MGVSRPDKVICMDWHADECAKDSSDGVQALSHSCLALGRRIHAEYYRRGTIVSGLSLAVHPVRVMNGRYDYSINVHPLTDSTWYYPHR